MLYTNTVYYLFFICQTWFNHMSELFFLRHNLHDLYLYIHQILIPIPNATTLTPSCKNKHHLIQWMYRPNPDKKFLIWPLARQCCFPFNTIGSLLTSYLLSTQWVVIENVCFSSSPINGICKWIGLAFSLRLTTFALLRFFFVGVTSSSLLLPDDIGLLESPCCSLGDKE